MYRKDEKVVQEDLAEVLSKSVTTEESDQLKKELSLKEFRWATKTMKRGKALGVDGLGIEVFKEVDYVLKIWWTVYNEMVGKLSRLMKIEKMILFYKKRVEKI
jgi:hypothetical protein